MKATSGQESAELRKLLDTIAEGLMDAVRREVERLRRDGLPVYVAENGQVVDLSVNPDR